MSGRRRMRRLPEVRGLRLPTTIEGLSALVRGLLVLAEELGIAAPTREGKGRRRRPGS